MPRNPIRIRIKGDKREVVISQNPDELNIGGAARTTTFDSFKETSEQPTGPGVTTYSWDGVLPGRSRRRAPYLSARDWEPPREVRDTLDDWRRSGREVTLSISELGIRDRVFVASFTHAYGGGHGDIRYSLELREYVELGVKRKKKRRGRDNNNGGGGREGRGRKTYTVRKGDTLQKIAKRFLGSVTRWREIWAIDANKRAIRKGANKPHLDGDGSRELKQGIELVIPDRKD